MDFAHITVVHSRYLAIVPRDRDRIPTPFGDDAEISGVASPVDAVAFHEVLRFADCHRCTAQVVPMESRGRIDFTSGELRR